MSLRDLEMFVSKYINLILQNFYSAPGLAWKVGLKKTKVKLDLLSNINMLLMVQKGIRGGVCHSIIDI